MIEYNIKPRNNEYGGILADLFASIDTFQYDSNIVYDRYHYEPNNIITIKFKTDDVFEAYFMSLLGEDGFIRQDIGFDLTVTRFNKFGIALIRITFINAQLSDMSFDCDENVMNFCCNNIQTEYLDI